MTPLEMIAEWRKGCSCAGKEHPEECHECTLALINAIENSLKQFKHYAVPKSIVEINGQIVELETDTRLLMNGEIVFIYKDGTVSFKGILQSPPLTPPNKAKS